MRLQRRQAQRRVRLRPSLHPPHRRRSECWPPERARVGHALNARAECLHGRLQSQRIGARIRMRTGERIVAQLWDALFPVCCAMMLCVPADRDYNYTEVSGQRRIARPRSSPNRLLSTRMQSLNLQALRHLARVRSLQLCVWNADLRSSPSPPPSLCVQMLERVFSLLREKNPNLAVRKRHVMPPPQLVRVGTRKTMWANFAQICQLSVTHTNHMLTHSGGRARMRLERFVFTLSILRSILCFVAISSFLLQHAPSARARHVFLPCGDGNGGIDRW